MAMQPYSNLSGRSGVVAFETGDGYIDVEFTNRNIYRYTNESAGSGMIAHMHELAISGRGLATYISQLKPRYERRLR